MATIREFHGNIFETSCQTIVNTVNCVGVMGKGIAFEFRHRYPEMFASYARLCKERRLRPGLLQLWTKSTPWILNFPTKNHWKHPSRLEYIEAGLKKFAKTYRERDISSIAFPQLGTSSGGLRWSDVRCLMLKYLEPLANLDVEIYQFDPSAKDTFFDRLYQRLHRFDVRDYKINLGIPPKQARIIRDALVTQTVRSMTELRNLSGVGEKTVGKLYAYVNQSGVSRVVTAAERQPSLLD